MKVFSVFDSAVQLYMPPFHMRTIGEAMRSFQDAVNDPKSQIGSHAGDYTLYLLAEFDDAGGVFSSGPPQRLASALEMVFKDITSNPDK